MERDDFFNPTGLVDDAETLQDAGCLPTWLIGLVIPAATIVYGVKCILDQSGWFIGRGSIRLIGDEAVALGIASISLGSFLVARFLLSHIRFIRVVAPILVVFSLVSLIGAMGFLLFRVVAFGS